MFVYWLMLVLQKGNRCSLFFLKRHLPSSSFYESRRRQPSIPTAQARLQGLQADPRRLANAHAAHKTPGKTSAGQAVRRLALWQSGIRRLSACIRCAPASSQSSSIHNSLSLDLTKSGLETSVFFLRQILRTPRFCLRTKSLRSLCKISSPKSQKTPAGLCPSYPHRGRIIAFATAVRSGPSALRGPLDSSYAGI